MPTYAEVAVPVPLPGALTYEVPDAFAAQARPGVRARVLVGRRRTMGVVVGVRTERPEGIELRPLEEIVDLEPVLGPELLALARWVADYYVAPLGEVLRALLPPDLPPWGDRRVWLTDAGALAPPRSGAEAAVVEALRDGGRLSAAELQARLRLPELPEVLERLAAAGRIGREERERRGARYVAAVELPPGDRAAQRAACGRSLPGQAVVEYLAAVGRPATVAEVGAATGASPAVVRRLVQRGVLRQFTQVEKLPLDRHMLGAQAFAPGSGSDLAGGGARGPAPLRLRADQQAALRRLTDAAAAGRYAPFLLQGMTGSGKTEVYLRAAETALAAGRSVLLLVPEIALVPALARAAEQRFGTDLAILHSGLGGPERQQEWERVRRDEARVVLGPRSALFAPLTDLGLVVVDEEQDPAYKQESVPRYHGRDLALVRGRETGAVTVLVSATPSMESRHNATRGKLGLLQLTERVGQGGLPEGVLVDLRGIATRRPGEVHFSPRLREEIGAALAAGDQVILLRNRRGYSPLLLCRACGEDMRCDECGLPRTYHRRAARLLCHYCGSTLAVPSRCPTCGETALEPIGAGTERVEETFAELFPGVALDVLDRDTARRAGGPAAILERFARGEVQVLIGTQMVSKGHHFPAVALTAVLAADTYLGFPDFRAVERTYNLLVQIAGRAGRGDRPGKVVIQTYHPDHYAIQAALRQDDESFAREELRFRRVFHYPPYTRMVQLLTHGRNRAKAEERVRELAARVADHPLAGGVRVTGPAPAPLERLRGEWRFQLLLRSAALRDLHRLLADVLPPPPLKGLVVDVDPQQLL